MMTPVALKNQCPGLRTGRRRQRRGEVGTATAMAATRVSGGVVGGAQWWWTIGEIG